jgi:arylsulfatase A-like enzyme
LCCSVLVKAGQTWSRLVKASQTWSRRVKPWLLADDLGFGDVKCNYPAGKIPTPNIDRLASQGMRFTDAHAPSSFCQPTRYAIMTGRYSWRTRQKLGGGWPWDGPLITADRLTLPELLRTHGYHTVALGKWHLGVNWPFASPAAAAKLALVDNQDKAEPGDIDWSKPFTGGPTERGFDYYFGVNLPNHSPYVFLENNHIVGPAPSERWPSIRGRLAQQAGPGQMGFDRTFKPGQAKLPD